VTTFQNSNLKPEILKAIEKLGFEKPTPVQAKVIPMLLKDKINIVALAQTGTGKTAAFGLPLLHLTDISKLHVQALVLCPTRELCLQITKDLASFGLFMPRLKVLPVYGGSSINVQMRELHYGVHILVATPGRMNDLMRRGCVNLEKVERVVLDEADEMLTMGFQEELETILKDVPDTASKLLFSATMPKQVTSIARKYMQNHEEVILGTRNAGAEQVTHECYFVHAKDRYQALRRIIDTKPEFYGIVFCRTRLETQEVAAHLADDHYNSGALHGDLSQDQRDQVMKNFRSRNVKILVATDVASRGLDVNDITHVVNYDIPTDYEVYTHRSGRTGRAGKEGVSIILANMREKYKIRTIEGIVKKTFVYKQVPSKQDVCNAQLVLTLDRIVSMDIPEKELAPYMKKITTALEGLSQDDLIKRLITRDFGHIMEAYKNAPDLNVQMHNDFQERRPRLPNRDDMPDHRHVSADTAMASVRINLGRRETLTPPILISLINRATHGPKLLLGRIKIQDTATVFEVVNSGAKRLVKALNEFKYYDKAVSANLVEGDAIDTPQPSHRTMQSVNPKHKFAKRSNSRFDEMRKR
jgi:ATP-dependent RNA helicase DeaD